ncbi:hypothetical protein [Albimonas pacifica]|uniref:Uncharacterized protein n=1 Tax=Albimonas pacifica TaxID=1114924 RepID=A0A1I3LHS4_9RHOB|nr:hypothetical protein [Albimonas pacifica]SFI83986.1 hypothetical protein SAMN05216258_11023 [Albimonas pacifica]
MTEQNDMDDAPPPRKKARPKLKDWADRPPVSSDYPKGSEALESFLHLRGYSR